MEPLKGLLIVNLATNLPGPVAAMRLYRLGAAIMKIEPPSGDFLATAAPEYYRKLCDGQTVLALDLKTPEGKAVLDKHLKRADLLLTASRPRAMERLGLDWPSLQAKYPRLCHVAIEGYLPPHENRAGHDLTYQAEAGLLVPPSMPKSLVSDLVAAEQAAGAALGLLLARDRGGDAGHATVAIAAAAESLAEPLLHGLTGDGPLGGRHSGYGIYAARDGFVALAALESHFQQQLQEALALERINRDDLERVFLNRSASDWQTWADQHDIPLAVVR